MGHQMRHTERKMEIGWVTLSADTGSGGRIKSHNKKLTAAKAGCPAGQRATIASEKMRGGRVVGHGILFHRMSFRTSAKRSNDTGI
jgi:hypothetical protein